MNLARIALIVLLLSTFAFTVYCCCWQSSCRTGDRLGQINCIGTTGWSEF